MSVGATLLNGTPRTATRPPPSHRAWSAEPSTPNETRAVSKPAIERQLSCRDVTLRRMLYEIAARASEIVALDITDLDLDARRARATSKGGVTEWV